MVTGESLSTTVDLAYPNIVSVVPDDEIEFFVVVRFVAVLVVCLIVSLGIRFVAVVCVHHQIAIFFYPVI